MAMNNQIDQIMGDIDSLRDQAYDSLTETIAANLENLDKKDILNIFNVFVQELKTQNREVSKGVYETNNSNFTIAYAHHTKSHISRIDATVDQLLININAKKGIQEVSENALPGNMLN